MITSRLLFLLLLVHGERGVIGDHVAAVERLLRLQRQAARVPDNTDVVLSLLQEGVGGHRVIPLLNVNNNQNYEYLHSAVEETLI